MSKQPATKKRATTVTRRYGGVDAAERRRERHCRLMDAGLEVFGTRGYHLSTVKDICAQASLTERYFYESFKTLGELFDAVYAELRSQVQQRVMQSVISQGMRHPEPVSMGESSLRAWYTFLHEDPRRARVMLIDAVSVSDSGMRGAEAAINEFKGMLRTFIGMMYPDVERQGINMDVIVSGLVGATIYIAKNWTQSGFKQSLDDIMMHNMLICRSLDVLYKQQQTDHTLLVAGRKVAPRTSAGRRASDTAC